METISDPPPIQSVSRMSRFGGFLIDWLMAWPLNLLSVIPMIGPLIVIFYWLLRDINGRSLGKVIVGTMIVGGRGGPATAMQRVVRNLPFAIFTLPLFIPILGVFAAILLQVLVFTAEVIAVLITGERIGDKIAGTTVVKRGAASVAHRRMDSLEF